MRFTVNNAKDIFTPKPLQKIGLGTAIQKILKPVAAVVGKSNCGGCRRRAEKLNKAVPNINPFA